MKFPRSVGLEFARPEGDEVLEGTGRQVEAVGESVAQEEDEKLVVVEGHAIIHPGTVVVHLQNTLSWKTKSTKYIIVHIQAFFF